MQLYRLIIILCLDNAHPEKSLLLDIWKEYQERTLRQQGYCLLVLSAGFTQMTNLCIRYPLHLSCAPKDDSNFDHSSTKCAWVFSGFADAIKPDFSIYYQGMSQLSGFGANHLSNSCLLSYLTRKTPWALSDNVTPPIEKISSFGP